MARSFLAKVSPTRSRTRVIDWPFPVEGDGPPPKIRLQVLGADKLEAANLDAVDHFEKIRGKGKGKVAQDDPAFEARERAAMVWYGVQAQDDDGKWVPIADSVDELTQESDRVITSIYVEWAKLQKEVTARPMTSAQMDALIDDLKKNTHAEVLNVLPSSWLIELVRTLASQQSSSTPASALG